MKHRDTASAGSWGSVNLDHNLLTVYTPRTSLLVTRKEQWNCYNRVLILTPIDWLHETSIIHNLMIRSHTTSGVRDSLEASIEKKSRAVGSELTTLRLRFQAFTNWALHPLLTSPAKLRVQGEHVGACASWSQQNNAFSRRSFACYQNLHWRRNQSSQDKKCVS